MRVGIFTRVFERPTVEEVFDAVRANGVEAVQTDVEPGDDAARVARAAKASGVEIAAVSGTFNMAHPAREEREKGVRWLAGVAEACGALGNPVLTLCTGTRNRESMWRRHPDNDTPEAWRDLVETTREALRLTGGTGAVLALEPEVANVVDSAAKARRLIDEIGSPRLKVCIDGANVFHTGELARMPEVIDETVRLLAPDAVVAHAKDLDHDGAAGHLPAGRGLLDYDRYIGRLREHGFDGAVILHGLTEADVPDCVAFLRGKMG